MTDLRIYSAAAARTVDWAINLIDAGGFRGCSPEVLAYYKFPIAMLYTGHAAKAAQILSIAEQLFYRNGDFHATATTTSAANAGRSYRNGWLAWGAHALGAFHLSEPTLDRLESSLDSLSGGAPDDDEVPSAEKKFMAGATASVTNALLNCGRVDAAIRAGNFLRTLFGEQSSGAKRIFLARNAHGEMIDPSVLGLSSGIENLVFDLERAGQICWIFGFALRVYARLFRATGDDSWIEGAQMIRGWIDHAHDSLYTNITNGKLAWGASEMYGATGDQYWRDLALRIGNWVCSEQDASGIWVRRPQFSAADQQPLPISLDTSIERMFYMIDIQRALALVSSAR